MLQSVTCPGPPKIQAQSTIYQNLSARQAPVLKSARVVLFFVIRMRDVCFVLKNRVPRPNSMFSVVVYLLSASSN